MGSRALRIATVRGVDVRVDASWLVIAALVTWSYWDRFDARAAHAGLEALLMAIIGAALFFGSILAHELAHALEAKRRGVHVGSITLFLFGGVTETRSDVRRPVDEFALTAVGPFTSFVLAAGLGLLAFGADEAGWAAVGAVAGLVAWINLALGVFNLLPGAPLDGGRLLRAGVWRVTGDRQLAIRVAARSGQVIGCLILTIGLLQLFFGPAAFSGGLWLAFIGWFLLRAAGAELAEAQIQRLLEGVTTRQLVDNRAAVSADASLAAAVERFRTEDADVLAVEETGEIVGILGIDEIRGVAPEHRAGTPVRDALRPVADLPVVGGGEQATVALEALGDEGVVMATEAGRVLGLVTAQRVSVILRRAQQLGLPAGQRP